MERICSGPVQCNQTLPLKYKVITGRSAIHTHTVCSLSGIVAGLIEILNNKYEILMQARLEYTKPEEHGYRRHIGPCNLTIARFSFCRHDDLIIYTVHWQSISIDPDFAETSIGFANNILDSIPTNIRWQHVIFPTKH